MREGDDRRRRLHDAAGAQIGEREEKTEETITNLLTLVGKY
jgi:hypothetical protein